MLSACFIAAFVISSISSSSVLTGKIDLRLREAARRAVEGGGGELGVGLPEEVVVDVGEAGAGNARGWWRVDTIAMTSVGRAYSHGEAWPGF